ncbi:GreA/GreB family elongation factor [Orrella sp. JC864]|uniref:GreA/GreB family elongation factor n=1 Tax=Orrella sp. JC864 TaxID=3120298 RepID=UPI00300807AD
MSPATERIFSELDRMRIDRLAARLRTPDGAVPTVLQAFDEGDFLMPQEMPPDVVTVNSRVLLVDGAGERREIVVCYPEQADLASGHISVLSPLGGDLLGRRVGESVDWPGADGRAVRLRIEALLFQPEANGEYAR